MSDEPPVPDTEPGPPPAGPLSPRPRRLLLPWLNTAGILVLAAALAWLAWRELGQTPAQTQTDVLAQQLGTLEARVARLEQRPQPQPADLGPLNARVGALEQRPAAGPAAPADLGPLEARIAALEQRKPPDLGAIEARMTVLEAKQPADAQLVTRLDALDKRVTTSEQSADVRAARLGRILAAGAALAAGRPLGKLADAPPALAKFAETAPPTLAALRLAFPAAVQAALAATPASPQNRPWYARMWAEARALVTIRRGEQVLLGDPTSGVLDRAREQLDAGDLAGAVALAGGLQGEQAEALADWLADARSLLDAQAALAEWAAHA